VESMILLLLILLHRWWYTSGWTASCCQQDPSTRCLPPTSHIVTEQASAYRAWVCIRGRRRLRTRLWIVRWF